MRTRWLSLLTSLVLLAAAAWLSPANGATLPAAATCTSCQTFLPLVGYDPTLSLLSPPNGVTTQSLAPILQWSPVITGTYQIQVSIDPTFLPATTPALSETKTVRSIGPIATLITSNLAQQTTFYWRVGLRKLGKYTYTAANSFRTPAKDSKLLPPGVHLIAPANNTTIGSTSVTLTWQAVPGALFYRVRVYDKNNVLFSAGSKDVPGTATALSFSGLAHGQTYYWKVKALNAYGWGSYTPNYYFTVP